MHEILWRNMRFTVPNAGQCNGHFCERARFRIVFWLPIFNFRILAALQLPILLPKPREHLTQYKPAYGNHRRLVRSQISLDKLFQFIYMCIILWFTMRLWALAFLFVATVKPKKKFSFFQCWSIMCWSFRLRRRRAPRAKSQQRGSAINFNRLWS